MTDSKAQSTSSLAADIRAKHAEYMLPAVTNFYGESLVLERGDGRRVEDVDGNRYLDFFGGILTVSIGHADDRINAPLKAQLDRLTHVSTLYPTVPMVELAERLAGLTPGNLRQSIFTPSGTDADDTAVVLAQLYTGAQEIIALRHSYSGRGTLSQALTGQSSWRAIPSQVPSVRHAVSPYCYRCPFGQTYPGCKMRCATDIEELIQTTTTGRVAAMIAEPIQGAGGFIVPPAEYFEIVVEIVRRHGGVFICDEVQTGFGRTGTKMFGIEHWGVEPEIMTMAKGIANGLPIAATIATPEIAASFQKLTISTFGGNPLSATAANATLGVIEQENLADNAEVMGARLRGGLEELQRRHPRTIGDVRGMGLMQGLELVADETTGDRTPNAAAVGRLLEETKSRQLLIGKGGLHGNCIRISPALTVTADEVDEAVAILGEAFAAMKA